MRAITLTYTLRCGTRRQLQCIHPSTGAAVCWAIEHFGDALRCCAARCTHPR